MNPLLRAASERQGESRSGPYAYGMSRSTLIDAAETYLLVTFSPSSAMNILAVADYLESSMRESYARKAHDELELMERILQRVAPKYGGLQNTQARLETYQVRLGPPPEPKGRTEPQSRHGRSLEDMLEETVCRLPAWERHDFASVLAAIAGPERYQQLYKPLLRQDPKTVGEHAEFLKQFTILPGSVTPSAAVLAYTVEEARDPYFRARVLLSLHKDNDRVKFKDVSAELLYTPDIRQFKKRAHEHAAIVGSFPDALLAAREVADLRLDARRASGYLRTNTPFVLHETRRASETFALPKPDETTVTVDRLASESALQQHTRPNWVDDGVRIRVTYRR